MWKVSFWRVLGHSLVLCFEFVVLSSAAMAAAPWPLVSSLANSSVVDKNTYLGSKLLATHGGRQVVQQAHSSVVTLIKQSDMTVKVDVIFVQSEWIQNAKAMSAASHPSKFH